MFLSCVLCFLFVVGLLLAFKDRISNASAIPVNMLLKHHRNAILTGYIDAYCLVCESHLRSEDDVEGHIAKPIHSKNLDNAGFLEKYKDDCVRKVKKGYYCEFCNILLSTAAKVGLHIAEEKHVNNKGSQLLKRSGINVIAFENTLINEKAWNGLIEETCAICNSEFDDANIHKTESTHILNLVQNKIEFGADKSIFRKIDESSYQCLTCNVVLGINTMTTHFDGDEHKKLYLGCQQNIDNETENGSLGNVQVKKDNVTPAPPKADIKKPVPSEVSKKADVPTVSAKKHDVPKAKQEPVKKPSTSVENQKKVEIPAAKVEKPKIERGTEDLDEAICKALNAKDYIANDVQGKKWCLLCDWTMDSIVIQTHVCGKHHQTMLKMHKERLEKKRMALQSASAQTEPEKNDTADQENRDKIVDILSKYQFYEFNINFDKKSIVCNKCTKSIEFDPKAVEQHIEDHKKAAPKKEAAKPTAAVLSPTDQKADEPKKPSAFKPDEFKKPQQVKEEREHRASSAASNKDNEEEVEKFAKSNELVYSRGDTKVYCRACDSRVPSSLKNMKEHVAGLSHKNKMGKWSEHKQNSKSVITKRPMSEFLRNVSVVRNGVMSDVIINERYCINVHSFFMITCVDRLHCETCEVNLSLDELESHKGLANHEQAMCDTKVITSSESEFLREVRPEIYHCGFCNVAFPSEDLPTHLASTNHREAKTSANWRLQQYLPEIMHGERSRQIGALLLLKMLNGESF